MRTRVRHGLTWAETVAVGAIVTVIFMSVMPHIWQVRRATRLSELRFNLQKLRERIVSYKKQHGKPPQDVSLALLPTDSVIPENPVSNAAEGDRNRVKIVDGDPPASSDVTDFGRGGWLYNPKTGGLWADHHSFLSE